MHNIYIYVYIHMCFYITKKMQFVLHRPQYSKRKNGSAKPYGLPRKFEQYLSAC